MPRLIPPRGSLPRTLRLLSGPVALGLLIPASAAAGDDEAAPATWDMSVQELQEVGLGQYRGDPIAPVDIQTEPPTSFHAKQGTIFVNFDGEMISAGSDSAQNNTSQIGFNGMFEAYGQGAKRDAVLEAVRADWSAYDMIITDSRPSTGDYTMNMTGPTNFIGPGVLGVAPLDCFDAMNPNNITYAFHDVNDMFSAAVTATTIGQEVAHSYGLEHVDQPADIMNPYNAGGDASFIDNCTPIVTQGAPIVCGQQHEMFCPTGSEQNAHQELLEIFGSSVPDLESPVVQITFPQDGDVFEPGSDFEIQVNATDDVQIAWVQLFNNGMALEMDSSEPYGWEVTSIPAGTYELLVTAIDTADNESMSNVVSIFVGVDPPDTDDEDSEDDDSDDDDSDDDDDDDDDDDGGADGGDGEKGCGCTTDAPAAPIWLLLPFLPVLAHRRRR